MSLQYYKVTMPDGSVKLLLNKKRAHGLAGHFGGTVTLATADDVRTMLKNAGISK